MANLTKYVVFRSSNLLLRLSGARLDILEYTPTGRPKFVGMGVAVLTSAVAAAMSMYFALRIAVQVPASAAIVLALTWGLATLSLNRFLLASLTGVRNWRSLLLILVPRILLSILLASVVSVPFVLQVFAPEINAEIPVIQQRQLNAYLAQEKTSPLTQKINADQAAASKLRATINSGGGPLPDPNEDPSVQSLTAQLNAAEANLKADYARWQCELNGGSNCASGNGIPARSAEAAYKAEMERVASLERQLSATVQNLNQTELANQQAEVEAAKSALPAVETRLRADQATQQAAITSFMKANSSRGILAQINALSAVTSGNSTLVAARYLLLLFFGVIDLMPMLIQFLLRLAPPSAYDMILENQERVVAEMARRRADMSLLAAEKEHVAELHAVERRRVSVKQTQDVSSVRLASFKEKQVTHADGELRRLEISHDEFLLVDILDGVPTLNWTASIGAREFVLLVHERLERSGDTEEPSAEIMISMAGIADQVDARLGVQLAALASPDFDRRSEFIRFDDPAIALALQSLHGDDGEQVKMFGVSAAGLSLDTVVSLMARTATNELAAHARKVSESPLITRMAELIHLPRQGDPALCWPVGGEVENDQAQSQMP